MVQVSLALLPAPRTRREAPLFVRQHRARQSLFGSQRVDAQKGPVRKAQRSPGHYAQKSFRFQKDFGRGPGPIHAPYAWKDQRDEKIIRYPRLGRLS
eukprot:5892230-Pyramimonas_sp.AAC.1